MKNAVLMAWLALAVSPVMAAPGDRVTAIFLNAEGLEAGRASIVEWEGGLLIEGQVGSEIAPGPHGIHIHTVGQCEPPFDSAGGHFNPTGKQHGHHNAAGHHAGDLSNIDVTADGRFEIAAEGLSLDATNLMDPDGSSIVIHAGPDDGTSDPSGNSGARLVCGVIKLPD